MMNKANAPFSLREPWRESASGEPARDDRMSIINPAAADQADDFCRLH